MNHDKMIDPEPVAIVGLACRFPGGVTSPSQLWDLLLEKRSGWAEFTEGRFSADAFHHPNGQRPGSMVSRGGYLLQEDVRCFDHAFFGMSRAETLSMDPAQRKLLEVSYEAFESAGMPWQRFDGSRTGVFVGNFNNDHQLMQFRDPDHTIPYVVTGGGPTILSNRISYIFNLHGPSLVVDTGCSASMYALHLAVLSLRNNDCDAALVAGSNLILGPEGQLFTTKLGAISPTSRCHTFDIAADGYARAEGFGALYLKKLSQAIADGDPIRALIRGTAFNANGKTGGISHPSLEGQEAVIRHAYQAAGGLDPNLTGYFECHGTGTPVGDPTEVAAIGRVFSSGRKSKPLLIGSVKPNLGHSEAASAMSQIIKSVLAMEYGEIPATIGLETPNPAIDFEGCRVRVVTKTTPWPKELLRRVSINSFGYGGANAHCIVDHPSIVVPGYISRGQRLSRRVMNPINDLDDGYFNEHMNSSEIRDVNGYGNGHSKEEANHRLNGIHKADPYHFTEATLETRPQIMQSSNAGSRELVLLPFSAHTNSSLKANVASIVNSIGDFDLADVLFTLGSRRSRFAHGGFLIMETCSLEANDNIASANFLISGKIPASPVQRIGFVFTGQGAQWPEMGAKLFAEYRICRDTIRYLDYVLSLLRQKPLWTIEEVLLEPAATGRINEPEISQTVCTALQIILVHLLRSWGIEPSVTVGHSSGEIAAAYAAKRLQASEAIALAYFRGQAVATNQRQGRMLAVGLGPNEVQTYLDGIESEVKIAAVNSPSAVTLSGDVEAINSLAEKMDANKVFNRMLETGGNAYHSHHMAALGETYECLVAQGLQEIADAGLRDQPLVASPVVQWISSVTPYKDMPHSVASPGYWRQNLESPVLFYPAVQVLAKKTPVDLLIEIGPHAALTSAVKQIHSSLEHKGGKAPPYLASLRRGKHDCVSMLTLAGHLFLNNAPIDLVAVNATDQGCQLQHGFPCIDFPRYQYDYGETPVYYENRFNKEFRSRRFLRHDLLGSRQPGGSHTHPSWRNMLRLKDLPWLDDHKLLPHAVLPAAAYISMAVEASRQVYLEEQNEKGNISPISAFRLRNVTINSTLRIPDNEIGVETILNLEKVPKTASHPSKWFRFSIGSLSPEEGAWIDHCSGIISVETKSPSIDLKLKMDSRARSLDITRWYDKFAQVGLGYGPAFRGLSELQAYWGSNLASARVALKSTATAIKGGESQYPLHPATLDTCLQLGLIACHAGQVENVTKAFVPIVVDELVVWVNDDPNDNNDTGWGVASGKIFGLRGAYVQTQLYSSSGQPLLDIKQLRCVAYDESFSQSSSSSLRLAREPYCRPVWRVDIDFLTNDLAQSIFPAQNIPENILHDFDQLAELMLVNIKLPAIPDPRHSHFLHWVSTTQDTMLRGNLSNMSADQRSKLIDDLVIQLGDIAELKAIKRLNDHLPEILDGKITSVKLLMEDNLWQELHVSGLAVQAAYTQLRHIIDLVAHKNPRARILELGAGTGGATEVLLDVLAAKSTFKRFQEYTFTDSQGWYLPLAQSKFAEYNGLSYRSLDIEHDPVSQGFELESFDLIIASSCLHQTNDLAAALEHTRSLVRPGGNLVLLELTQSRLGFELLSRTLMGQWDIHRSPFMDEVGWNNSLVKAGFSGVDVALNDYSANKALSTVMLSTNPLRRKPASLLRPGVYLIYRNYPPPLSRAIAKCIEKEGLQVTYLEILQSTQAIPSGSMVVSLIDIESVTLTTCDAKYLQAIQAIIPQASYLTWIALGSPIDGTNPESGSMKGLLRSIQTENLLLKITHIEISSIFNGSLDWTAQLITSVTLRTSIDDSKTKLIDREYSLHNGALYVERLLPDESLNNEFQLRHGSANETLTRPMDSQERLRARYKQPGILSSLYFEADPSFEEALPEDWVEIKTKAIGLNVKDLAVATGRFDWDFLSTEVSGIISRIGPAVTTLTVGDRVFGAVPGQMGNYVRSHSSLVQKLAPTESFAAGASMPVSYLTAIYAFQHVARLRKGESVLIQSATGGLGMSAMKLAKHIGANIYATVGNEKKRSVLIDEFGIPEHQIFDSRDLTAVDKLMRVTGGNGIDVILSSSGGDMMNETWRCIAPMGRFIDVGRTDVLAAGQLGLGIFKRNATFSSFDLGLTNRQNPRLLSLLMEELRHLWSEGAINPVDHIQTFDISQLESAMRYFAKGVHLGKVVITFDDPKTELKIAQVAPRVYFDPNATYLLVGCLGGLGRSLATWMVDRGARHLAFMSRSGHSNPEAAALIQELSNRGVKAEIIRCSVTDKESVVVAVNQISAHRPLKGVVHAAMVEGDSLFENLKHGQLLSVLAPKVTGTLNLHHATAGHPLSFFLMTSSIVATIGTPTQGAYCAGNAFQDAFARYRKAQSLPATSLALGLIQEVGSVRNLQAFQQMLQRNASYGISETEFLQLVEGALCSDNQSADTSYKNTTKLDSLAASQVLVGFDPNRFVSSAQQGRMGDFIWHSDARFQAVVQAISDRVQAYPSESSLPSSSSSSARERLQTAETSEEALTIAIGTITERLATLLDLAVDDIDSEQALTRYGIDSMTAAELRNWLIKTFGVEVSLLQLLGERGKVAALAAMAIEKK